MIRPVARLWTRFSHLNWALADQTMVSGVNFLTGILLARYLGLEEFGRFTLAWMAVLFVNSIQHAAIISPMMSIGPKQAKADTRAYYGAVLTQQIIFSGLTFLLLFAGVRMGGALFPQWNLEGLALPLAAAGLAVQLQDFLRRYFFTHSRGGAAFFNDALRYLGQFAVLAWLFLTYGEAMDSAGTLWVIAVLAMVAAVSGVFFLDRVELKADIFYTTAWRHWHFSKWLTASAVLLWTSGNLFIIAAGGVLGASAVGALKAAQNLMGLTHILFQGLENIIPVRAAEIHTRGGARALKPYLRRVALMLIASTAVITLIFAVEAEYWLGLIFGEPYVTYGDLVRWYAVIYTLAAIALPLRVALRTVEHTRPIFVGYLVSTVVSVTAAYPVVQWLGLTGTMAGLLFCQILVLLVLWHAVRKELAA